MQSLKELFLLDPEITFLNHGSFGACPREVFSDYQHWQAELEKEPVQFIVHDGPVYLRNTKKSLADFIICEPDDFFFVPNPTVAVNTIMRSVSLDSGDEILATDHEYGAMDRVWNFYASKSGAKFIRQHISLPVRSQSEIADVFWSGVTGRTKVIFMNHMSSATALIFPVAEICRRARQQGIITIIDGAHIPGHIDLDIRKLDPDYYTGTAHKWMLSPKGSSFLYVRKELQDQLDPLVVSWGYESLSPGTSRFLDYHEFQGTRDISAFLATSAAIKFLKKYDWPSVSARCKQMILENYEPFCDLLGTTPICPVSDDFLGQMCSIPINTSNPQALKAHLFEKYRIEIPVMSLNGKSYLRISLNGYNDEGDLLKLESALKAISSTTPLLA